MTLDEFTAALEATPRKWRNRGGNIRSGHSCPITAVCHAKCGVKFPTSLVLTAADYLGLAAPDAWAIVAAADSPGNQPLRKRLRKACGIEVPPCEPVGGARGRKVKP